MPTLTQYTKTTEANIISSPPSGDGEMAYATDTKSFFFSDGTNWVKWKSTTDLSKYSLGGKDLTRPRFHFDASDASTMINDVGQVPGHNDLVSSIKCKATGHTLTSFSAVEQPKYVSSTGVLPIGETSGEAMINSLGTLQFNGSVALQDNVKLQNYPNEKLRDYEGYTDFIVCKRGGEVTTDKALMGSFGNPNQPHDIAWGTSYIRQCGNKSIQNREYNATSRPDAYAELEDQPIQMMFRESKYVGALNGNYGSSPVLSQVGGVTVYDIAPVVRPMTSYGFILGGNGASTYVGSSRYWEGEIGEVIIFEHAISVDDINHVGNYLSNKWGTVWNDL